MTIRAMTVILLMVPLAGLAVPVAAGRAQPSMRQGDFATLRNFDAEAIDPNAGSLSASSGTALPIVGPSASGAPGGLGCHQVGQVYVWSQDCRAVQFASPAEAYAYSLNAVNDDPGGPLPASGPGTSGRDKVVLYLGGDQNSRHSMLWLENRVMQERPGMAGGALAEWDLNRLEPCQTPRDDAWIGGGCAAMAGLWLTGLSGGGTGGSAIFITAAGAPPHPLWNTGVMIASAAAVRDTGFLDASTSETAFKVRQIHGFGLDMSAANLDGAGILFMSGDFWGAENYQDHALQPVSRGAAKTNGQGIFWNPNRNGNRLAGGTDSITDYGSGLRLRSDAAHGVSLEGGAVAFTANAVYVNAPHPAVRTTPYLAEDPATGHLHVGQAGAADGAVDVDGAVTAASLRLRAATGTPPTITLSADRDDGVLIDTATPGGVPHTRTRAVKVADLNRMLPCSARNGGDRATVADARSPRIGARLLSGGTSFAPAFCDGTAWIDQ